jgi:hypothetical protein
MQAVGSCVQAGTIVELFCRPYRPSLIVVPTTFSGGLLSIVPLGTKKDAVALFWIKDTTRNSAISTSVSFAGMLN